MRPSEVAHNRGEKIFFSLNSENCCVEQRAIKCHDEKEVLFYLFLLSNLTSYKKKDVTAANPGKT